MKQTQVACVLLCLTVAACRAVSCDCNDLDVCTIDICDNVTGTCTYEPIEFHDVGPDPCVIGYYCDRGLQAIVEQRRYCNDANPCTTDSCDSLSGECVFEPNASCIYGCNRLSGQCEQEWNVSCDDGVECTHDFRTNVSCTHWADCMAPPCIDIFCNQSSGACETRPRFCADIFNDTIDFCDPAINECVYNKTDPNITSVPLPPCPLPFPTWCGVSLYDMDGRCAYYQSIDPLNDFCLIGVCRRVNDTDEVWSYMPRKVPTSTSSCRHYVCDSATQSFIETETVCPDDGDPCTFEACVPNDTCVHTPVNCTGEDPYYTYSCSNSTGECLATLIECPDDGDLCTIEFYDPASQECVTVVKDCTNQTHGDLCLSAKCDPLTGGCVVTPIPIDDGNLCTIDTCVNNTVYHLPVNCSDGDACTEDRCSETTGTCHHIDTCTPRYGRIFLAIVVACASVILSILAVVLIVWCCSRTNAVDYRLKKER